MKKFNIVKEVTLPVRQLAIEKAAYLQFTAPIRMADSVDESTGEQKDLPIMNCIDLETDKSCQIVVPSVLHGIITDNYPQPTKIVDGEEVVDRDAQPLYVGKAFQIIKGRKPSGKRYHTFTLCEVEVEEEAPKSKK